MNDPAIPPHRAEERRAAFRRILDVPPPGPLPPPEVIVPVAAWLERQLMKLLAMISALAGGAMEAGDGRCFAWFVAVVTWLCEVWHSRTAEKVRRANELKASLELDGSRLISEKLMTEATPPLPKTERCPLTCPHGDRCSLTAGHDCGCNHKVCPCNEKNSPLTTDH